MTNMQSKEKYSLTWHSYSDHLREALKEMMTTNEFSDVTLVTDDKQQIRAHRNILSALVLYSRIFYNLTVRMQIRLFTSEAFSILKWSQ